MIPPGALVLLSPLVVGILFGTRTLAGLLAGALVSGVQMAVSMSNTGGGFAEPEGWRSRVTASPCMYRCPCKRPVLLHDTRAW